MYKTYFCPNCRATIYYKDKFCGNCGVSLKWIEIQTPLPHSHPPYNNLTPGQQKGSLQQKDHYHQIPRQKSGVHSNNYRTQKMMPGNPQRQWKENTNSSRAVVQEKITPADDNAELLKSEVAKLLEHFFEKVG